jgi:hypothetical protein
VQLVIAAGFGCLGCTEVRRSHSFNSGATLNTQSAQSTRPLQAPQHCAAVVSVVMTVIRSLLVLKQVFDVGDVAEHDSDGSRGSAAHAISVQSSRNWHHFMLS